MSAAVELLEGAVSNSNRRGRFIVTYTGIRFWPLDPRPEEILIEDIAHSLSMQCRFNGHIESFYSVADHCVRVSAECADENKLCGLLHDASEAYLCDIAGPIKKYFPEFIEMEKKIMKAICLKYHMGIEMPDEVKRIDNAILNDEKEQTMKYPYAHKWDSISESFLGCKIKFYRPDEVEFLFLKKFLELKGI